MHLLEGGFHGHHFHSERQAPIRRSQPGHAATLGASRHSEHDRHEIRLRHGALRRLHRAYQRRSYALLHHRDFQRRRQESHHHRRTFRRRQPSRAASLDGRRRSAVRLLPVRPDHVRRSSPFQETQAHRRRHRRCHERQHLPLRHLPAHPQSHSPRRVHACRQGQVRRLIISKPFRPQEKSLRCSMATAPVVNRRDFLKKSAAGGTALVIGFYLPAGAHAQEAPQQEKKPPNPLNAWVRITPDNRVTLILGKSEMGQGIMTALPMILAEELYLDWKNVRIEQAPTNPKIYDHGTGGSGSVAGSWLPMRRAGAAAREMLVSAAAARWNVNPNTCKARNGQVVHGNPQRYLAYGELVEAASKLPIPNLNTVPLKNSNDFTVVGHDTRRLEGRDKATGVAKFGIDSRVPGMLFAVVARCPVFGGKVASFDASKTKTVAGVRD